MKAKNSALFGGYYHLTDSYLEEKLNSVMDYDWDKNRFIYLSSVYFSYSTILRSVYNLSIDKDLAFGA